MSNSIYSEPVNTPTELYISDYGSSMSFSDLADHITAHFGEDVKINEFTLELKHLQVRGCSCCHDSSDYEDYLLVTKRDKPDEFTNVLHVSSLSLD